MHFQMGNNLIMIPCKHGRPQHLQIIAVVWLAILCWFVNLLFGGVEAVSGKGSEMDGWFVGWLTRYLCLLMGFLPVESVHWSVGRVPVYNTRSTTEVTYHHIKHGTVIMNDKQGWYQSDSVNQQRALLIVNRIHFEDDSLWYGTELSRRAETSETSISTRLHGAIHQKAVIFTLAAIRT
jgi:hypothetical protein